MKKERDRDRERDRDDKRTERTLNAVAIANA